MVQAGNKVTTSNGASCSQDTSTGRWAEFNAETNPNNNDTTFSFTYKIELGRDKIRHNDCTTMYDLEVRRQRLELQRLELELQQMRSQINSNNKQQPVTTGDDW